MSSQRRGAGDEAGLRRSVAAHLSVAGLFALVLTLVFSLLARPMLTWLRTPDNTLDAAATYLTILYLGIPATALYNFLANTMRAVGDSRTPLVLLACSSILNIGLDLLMIVVFRWGVAGAAIATVLAQLISGLLCLAIVVRRMRFLLPDRESWRGVKDEFLPSLKTGVPMGLQLSVIAIGMIVLQFVLNGFGSDAVAAYTVGGRIQSLAQNPLMTMNTVMATYAGQNYGARAYGRIRRGVKSALLFTVGLAVAIAAAVLLLRRPILLLFIDASETAALELAERYLFWCCPPLFLLSFLFVCRGALQGLGNTVIPLFGSALELAMRAVIPAIFGSALGFTAICLAGPAAWLACGGVSVAAYFVLERRLPAE